MLLETAVRILSFLYTLKTISIKKTSISFVVLSVVFIKFVTGYLSSGKPPKVE